MRLGENRDLFRCHFVISGDLRKDAQDQVPAHPDTQTPLMAFLVSRA